MHLKNERFWRFRAKNQIDNKIIKDIIIYRDLNRCYQDKIEAINTLFIKKINRTVNRELNNESNKTTHEYN